MVARIRRGTAKCYETINKHQKRGETNQFVFLTTYHIYWKRHDIPTLARGVNAFDRPVNPVLLAKQATSSTTRTWSDCSG
jgi:hypothetical protein